MKSLRTHRSKSLPTSQSPKKSLFSKISHRLSLGSRKRSNSVRLYDDSDDDDTIQVIPQEVNRAPGYSLVTTPYLLTTTYSFDNHPHNHAFLVEPLVSGLFLQQTNSKMTTLSLNLRPTPHTEAPTSHAMRQVTSPKQPPTVGP